MVILIDISDECAIQGQVNSNHHLPGLEYHRTYAQNCHGEHP